MPLSREPPGSRLERAREGATGLPPGRGPGRLDRIVVTLLAAGLGGCPSATPSAVDGRSASASAAAPSIAAAPVDRADAAIAEVATADAAIAATPTEAMPAAPPRFEVTVAPAVDELLLLRVAESTGWIGLRRGPDAPNYALCEEIIAPAEFARAHLDLIQGEVRVTLRRDGGWDQPICEVVRVDARFAADAHPIRPITREHLGDLILGLPRAEQAPWLADADLERGPLRIVFGLESMQARFASAYLRDLGTHVAIPGRPLETVDEVRADIDARATGKGNRPLNMAHHFAPQVADAATRIAFARTPVIELPGDHRGLAPVAVPLEVAGERRYLLMQGYQMKFSWETAHRRGRVIERIVDDGARPASR